MPTSSQSTWHGEVHKSLFSDRRNSNTFSPPMSGLLPLMRFLTSPFTVWRVRCTTSHSILEHCTLHPIGFPTCFLLYVRGRYASSSCYLLSASSTFAGSNNHTPIFTPLKVLHTRKISTVQVQLSPLNIYSKLPSRTNGSQFKNKSVNSKCNMKQCETSCHRGRKRKKSVQTSVVGCLGPAVWAEGNFCSVSLSKTLGKATLRVDFSTI